MFCTVKEYNRKAAKPWERHLITDPENRTRNAMISHKQPPCSSKKPP